MGELVPSAEYKSGNTVHKFTVDPNSPHTTNGKTTGPSEFVLRSEKEDKDKPSDYNPDVKISRLRAYITTLQDDVNIYLTNRMNQSSNLDEDAKLKERDIERRVLDDGVDEDDE